MESATQLCAKCARSPTLSAPRAFLFEPTHIAWQLKLELLDRPALRSLIASFMIVQFSRLNWPMPDRIAIVPHRQTKRALYEIAQDMSRMLKRPLSNEFALKWVSPFEWQIIRTKEDSLENQSVLLIDFDGEAQVQQKALNQLWPAFVREVHILSVMER